MEGSALAHEWQRVPLAPIPEPLVRLEPTSRILVEPAYRARGYTEATDGLYVRRGVCERLTQAACLLPPCLCLLVWDGWRSLDLQERLHSELRAKLVESSGLSGPELEEVVSRFVAEPSDDPRCPSPHLTGGAVDLTLALDGSPLAMGSAFDAFGPSVRTDYFENVDLADGDRSIRHRRRLLCRVMSQAGFSNYPHEWWHFDLGNQFWGLREGRDAYYGAIQPPE